VSRADDEAQLERLPAGRDVCELRGVTQIQVEELGEDQLAEVAVLGEDEGVVEARDQENVLHVVGHQVLEPALTAPVVPLGSLPRTRRAHQLSRQRQVAVERSRLLPTATF